MERPMLETSSMAAMATFEERSHAARAVGAAVYVLAERLTHDEARSLVSMLPEDLGDAAELRERYGGCS
jgi:hypothetical protein